MAQESHVIIDDVEIRLIDFTYKNIGSMRREALMIVLVCLVVLTCAQSKCYYPCQTCKPTDPNACLSCMPAFRLVGNTCVQCTVSYCGSCTDTTCLKCLDTFVYVPFNNSCVCRQTYTPVGNSTNATCQCKTSSSSAGANFRAYPAQNALHPTTINLGASSSVTTLIPKVDFCYTCTVDFCLACLYQNDNCSQCLPTYISVPSTGKCVQYCNIDSCTTCSSWNFCSQCQGGLVPSANGDACISCSQDVNCVQCITSNVCQTCKTGYVLSNNLQCVTCNVANCKTCGNNDQCAICNEGYLLTGGACLKCAFPCQTCNPDSTCRTCAYPPYSLYPAIINGTAQCFSCQTPHCVDCQVDTLTICNTCENGYKWNADKSICELSCTIPNCVTCNAEDPTKCDTCAQSFFSNGGICSQCQTGCLSCTSVEVCNTCASGFYLNGGICLACASFCSSCSSATICNTLIDSHGKTIINIGGQSFIAHCNPGCAQCSSNNPANCLVCSNGFYSSAAGICSACPTNSSCKTCDPANPAKCLTCYPQYFLTTNGTSTTCVTCNSTNNCQTCTSTDLNTCLTCPQGYQLNSGVCAQSGCPIGCVACSKTAGGKPCNRCLPGFALNADGVCLPCVTGCSYCVATSINQCLNCGPGNILNANGQCAVCTKFCASCNSIGCVSCVAGYYLTSSFTCAPNCVFPCQTCDANQPSICLTCVAGYILGAENVCQSNLNCGNTGNVCPVCPFGSYRNKYQCTACTATNCARCDSDPNVCSSCLPRSYFSNGNCISCSAGCGVCTSNTICLSCLPGYTSVNLDNTLGLATCQQCASQCKTCSSSINLCTSCIQTYTLQNGKCISTFNYQFTIVLMTDFPTFTLNYLSFLNALSAPVNSDITRVTLNALVTGSVSATGNITTTSDPQTSNSQDQYNNLYQSLQTGSIGGMNIISYDISANGGDPHLPEDSNLVLILAICIPIGVILIVAIVVFIVWKKKKSTNDELKTKLKDSEGLVSSQDGGDQPTHKNLKDSE